MIEPLMDGRTVVIVTAGTIVLASLAGLAPAIRAYRTPVAEHLRPID